MALIRRHDSQSSQEKNAKKAQMIPKLFEKPFSVQRAAQAPKASYTEPS